VEEIMLFAAVIVCLMGIMYQANELSSYYPESKDSVTAVVLGVIIIAIVYFFVVLITEIVVLYNEDARARQLARLAKAGKLKAAAKADSGAAAGSGKGRLVDDAGEINTGKMDTQMNPLFLNNTGGATLAADATGIDAIMAQRTPPPQELWILFQQGYSDMHKQLEAANTQLAEAKKREQLGLSAGAAGADDDGPAAAPGARKKAFAPRGTAGGDGGAGSGNAASLAAFRRNAKGPALRSMRAGADGGGEA
jgi:hypothetical protein